MVFSRLDVSVHPTGNPAKNAGPITNAFGRKPTTEIVKTVFSKWSLIGQKQNNWRILRVYRLLADVIRGAKFKDGERVELDQLQGAA
jgi:hypothetical protein